MGSDLDGRHLKVEQLALKLARDLELREACPRLLRQVIGELEVHVVWRNCRLGRPARLDYLGKLISDVERPAVTPTVSEPPLELVTRIVVEYIDVELALCRQRRECQVTATEEADDWGVRVLAVK